MRAGAYSVMNSAVARASGKAIRRASRATCAVPSSTAEMPMMSRSGCHSFSMKKFHPYRRSVGIDW